MITLAFCLDSSDAPAHRKRWYEPHMEHLRSIREHILLGAPLASDDREVVVSGGKGFFASVFALESPSDASAVELIRADPYLSGGVWESVALFEISAPSGEWHVRSGPGRLPKPLYVSFCESKSGAAAPLASARADHHRYMSGLQPAPVFSAELNSSRMIGATHSLDAFQSVDFVPAGSIAAARDLLDAEPNIQQGHWVAQVAAIPMAVGHWTGNLQF